MFTEEICCICRCSTSGMNRYYPQNICKDKVVNVFICENSLKYQQQPHRINPWGCSAKGCTNNGCIHPCIPDLGIQLCKSCYETNVVEIENLKHRAFQVERDIKEFSKKFTIRPKEVV